MLFRGCLSCRYGPPRVITIFSVVSLLAAEVVRHGIALVHSLVHLPRGYM